MFSWHCCFGLIVYAIREIFSSSIIQIVSISHTYVAAAFIYLWKWQSKHFQNSHCPTSFLRLTIDFDVWYVHINDESFRIRWIQQSKEQAVFRHFISIRFMKVTTFIPSLSLKVNQMFDMFIVYREYKLLTMLNLSNWLMGSRAEISMRLSYQRIYDYAVLILPQWWVVR